MQTQCFSSLILCWTWAGFWTECLTSLGWTGLERKIWPITVSFILLLDFGTWEGAGQTWSGVLLRDHFHCVVLSVTQMTEQTPLSLFCSQTFSINTPMFLSTHCLLPYMRAFAQVADSFAYDVCEWQHYGLRVYSVSSLAQWLLDASPTRRFKSRDFTTFPLQSSKLLSV